MSSPVLTTTRQKEFNIMNVTELKALVDQALEQGLHPETTVVVAHDGWYTHVDLIEHPKDGKSELDMWFTITPSTQEADSRFTPGHFEVPDPDLYAEYVEDRDSPRTHFEEGYYTYLMWLEERCEGLAGALRDDPPRARGELADCYRGLSALLAELERMDPS